MLNHSLNKFNCSLLICSYELYIIIIIILIRNCKHNLIPKNGNFMENLIDFGFKKVIFWLRHCDSIVPTTVRKLNYGLLS